MYFTQFHSFRNLYLIQRYCWKSCLKGVLNLSQSVDIYPSSFSSHLLKFVPADYLIPKFFVLLKNGAHHGSIYFKKFLTLVYEAVVIAIARIELTIKVLKTCSNYGRHPRIYFPIFIREEFTHVYVGVDLFISRLLPPTTEFSVTLIYKINNFTTSFSLWARPPGLENTMSTFMGFHLWGKIVKLPNLWYLFIRFFQILFSQLLVLKALTFDLLYVKKLICRCYWIACELITTTRTLACHSFLNDLNKNSFLHKRLLLTGRLKDIYDTVSS